MTRKTVSQEHPKKGAEEGPEKFNSPEEPHLSDKMMVFVETLRQKGLHSEAEEMLTFANAAAALEKTSRTDELTGLLNRRGFSEEWNRYLAVLGRERTKKDEKERVFIPSAFLALDLDGFKLVNNTVGHEAGDRFLQLVAEKVSPLLRKEDVLGRIGGDEFTVFLFGSTAEGAKEVASEIRGTIEGINAIMREEYKNYTVQVSASIGIAAINGEGQIGDDEYTTIEQHPTMEEIKRYADYASYVVKIIGDKGREWSLREAWEADKDRKIWDAFLKLEKKAE